MRQYIPVITLAAALALLLGVLLPSDNAVFAADPEFDTDPAPGSRSVPENTPPGVNIGAPVSATDGDETGEDAIEFGNTLTYKLSGDDAASFDIDPSTGQLITKAALDYENPHDVGNTANDNDYVVTVTVDDGETRATDSPCTACTQTVTIDVTNVNEPPATPPPPTVVSGLNTSGTNADESTTSLKVVWHPLVNTGRPTISGYNVQYKESTEFSFSAVGASEVTVDNNNTTATITGLSADTSYQVRVQASNTDVMSNDGPWSLVGIGSTNKEGNSRPSFTQTAPYTLNMAENSSSAQSVGVRVTADDADSRTLSYRFEGRDAGLFDFNSSTGQIRTKRGVTYNHEDPACGYPGAGPNTACTYYVTVVALDGAGGSDALRVAISVTDRTELPSAPARPTVRPTANSRTSLDVSWSEPVNTGPAITLYSVEYRLKDSGNTFSTDGVVVTGATAKISGTDSNNDNAPWLTAGASYEVRVRATSDEGTGGWSPFGTGNTNAGNREPVFRDRNIDVTPVGIDATTERELNENTSPGRPVGRPVAADDGDGDKRTYKLVAAIPDDDASEAAAAKFDINDSTGQIMTKESPNHEDEGCGYVSTNDTPTSTTATTCTYTVVVEVRDGLDANRVKEADETTADDIITVEITVKDLVEIPSVPTVIVTSPEDVTKLDVKWYATNTGPPITTVNLQYKQGSSAWSDDNCNTIVSPDIGSCSNLNVANGALTGIEILTANTQYQVRMQATNVEGTSAWSSPVSQRTNRNKSDSTANSAPTFVTQSPDLVVNESHERSAQDVGTITTDDDDGGAIRYSLEGPNKNLFTINSSGLIKTRSGLDFEDPGCVVDPNDATKCMYPVFVKIDDGQGASGLFTFMIKIQDVPEPPSAPSRPSVTATTGSGKKLDMTWREPGNNGPPITDYDIQYREVGGADDDWLNWPHGSDGSDSTETTTTITGLDPRTRYEVEVQATNDEGTSPWSPEGVDTTNASNLRPSFDDTAPFVTLSVDENTRENTRAGQPVGSPVSATDNDGNRLTYTLEGPGKDSFTILSSSGQIRTRVALDHEERDSYSVTVKVNDGQRKSNSVAAKSVTIEVANVVELPSVPGAPRVVGIPGSTSSVRVTWDEPANTGPVITDYDVQYGAAGTGGFSDWIHQGVDRSTIIAGLTSGTRYEVRVRARNADGASDYSRSGTGMPNPDVANRNPVFSGGARTFSIDENTAAGDPIGDPIAATDPDDDPLGYELEGTDAASFDIDRGSGQIRTSAELNHEAKSRYSVTVRVRDGRGGTSTANVTINVTDLVEPPSTPLSPTVTAVSSTRLQVSWEEPDNTGPPITDYDYRYQGPSDSNWTEDTNTTITGTTVTIPGLTPSTFYDVSVRAKNAEGTSEWSNPGFGSTNAPGANNLPVFAEGSSATRRVSAAAPSGTLIGEPVAATDADSDDTLEYSLEGRDAANFEINETNGQLRTRTGVTLFVGTTYTVTVVADDGTDTANIEVSIEATAAPPNAVPAFTEGAATTRSVFEGTPAGTNIGSPVRATDADTGRHDHLHPRRNGRRRRSTSLLRAARYGRCAALNASTKATYSVTVVASDGKARATITVTITVTVRPNSPPVFSEGVSTSRSVVEPVAPFTEIGSPVVATDADDDTLTYTIGGTDAASFFIDPSTGQLFTRIALTVDTKATYTVTVVASDGEASSRITVTINVTPPPNNVPVFNEGTSATRSVRDDARAGTSIGAPVTATDADSGDTVTYSLGGTDAASFGIVASSGQIQTRAALDASTKSTYSVIVVASDGKGRATITVTINVTAAPTSFGCGTNGAVVDASNTGLVSDCEALMRASEIRWRAPRGLLNWSQFIPDRRSGTGVYLGGTPEPA